MPLLVNQTNYGTSASKFVDPQFLQRIYTLLYRIKHTDVLEVDDDACNEEEEEALEIEAIAAQLNTILGELEKTLTVTPSWTSETQYKVQWTCSICQSLIKVTRAGSSLPSRYQEYTCPCPACRLTYTIDWLDHSVKAGK